MSVRRSTPSALMLAVMLFSTAETGPSLFWSSAFTLQDVLVLIGLAGTLVTIAAILRRNRREDAADKKAAAEEVANKLKENFEQIMAEISKGTEAAEKRLSAVEMAAKTFVPRQEIEQKIEHEKSNRLTISTEHQRQLEKNAADIVDIRVGIAKRDQMMDSIASEMHEIKALLKEHVRDNAAKLDRISTDLTALAVRKAA